MDRINQVSSIGKIDWKFAFNLAVGFHVLIIAGSIYLPQLLKSKPKHPEIYSVDLVNYVEPSPAPPAAAPQAVETITPKIEARKIAPIAETPPPAVPKPEKVISLKPIKKKVKKKITSEPDINRQRQLAEAKKAQQAADEAARLARQEADLQRRLLEAELAEARQIAAQINSNTNRPTGSRNSGSNSGAVLSGVEKQFYNALTTHIHQYWQLPAIKNWDPNLSTTMAITINRNGRIRSMFVEQSSGDKVFDQYVKKALQDADPLPAIPPALRKSAFDIGLVFKPGGIQ